MSAITYAEQALDLHPCPAVAIEQGADLAFISVARSQWIHAEIGDSIGRVLRDEPHLLEEIRAASSGKIPERVRVYNEHRSVTCKLRLKPITTSAPGSIVLMFNDESAKLPADDRTGRRAALDYAPAQIWRISSGGMDPRKILDRMMMLTYARNGVPARRY
jgi:hypothetical protein